MMSVSENIQSESDFPDQVQVALEAIRKACQVTVQVQEQIQNTRDVTQKIRKNHVLGSERGIGKLKYGKPVMHGGMS